MSVIRDSVCAVRLNSKFHANHLPCLYATALIFGRDLPALSMEQLRINAIS